MSGPASPSSTSSSLTRDTSRYLLVRARLGDTGALNRLVGRYLPRLRRWAHGKLPAWVRSGLDTSDLIQDAFLRSIPRIGAFDPRGKRALGAYLQRVVQNRIRDEHRRIARRDAPAQLSEPVLDGRPSPFDEAVLHETEARYREALASLSPGDREIIVAHVELDYTHEQLGCMTGRTSHAARMALQRAVRRLTARMRDAQS